MAIVLKIKAAVLTGLKKIEILNIESRRPLEKWQVLVKIYYAGVCGSQLMEYQGKRGKDKWLPHLLGHEGVGKVIGIGPSVTKFKKGDWVIIGWIKNKGVDSNTPTFNVTKRSKKIINSGNCTTFSNYSIISANRLTHKPPYLPLKESVLFGCSLPTGMGMVIKNLRNKNKNKSVLVIGSGGVGLAAILALYCYDFLNITVVDKSINKLKFVKSNFNYKTILYDEKTINQILKSKKYDYCIECSGTIKGIEFGFDKINDTGTLIFASHPPTGKFIKVDPHEIIKGKKIQGTWGGGISPAKDINYMLELISKKQFKLSKLLSKPYKLTQVKKIFDTFDSDQTFRPLIKMDHR